MKILIASNDEKRLNALKREISERGHTVLVFKTIGGLKNLIRAWEEIDGIITDYKVGRYKGTDLIASVGICTPTLVIGSRSKVINFVLKKRCFINAVFIPNITNSEQLSTTVHQWLDQLEKNQRQTQKCA